MTQNISDIDAQGLLRDLPNAKPEDQPIMREKLSAWREQVRKDESDNIEKVFTDPEKWGGQWTPEHQKLADMTIAPEASKHGMANIRWIAAQEGHSTDDIADFLPAYRKAYAVKYFGKPDMGDSEFYGAIKTDYEGKRARANIQDKVIGTVALQLFDEYNPAIKAPIANSIELGKKLVDLNPDMLKGLDAEGQSKITRDVQNMIPNMRAAFEKDAPTVGILFRALTSQTGQIADENAPTVTQAVSALAQLAPEKRKAAYDLVTLALAAKGLDTKSEWMNAADALGRGTIGMVNQMVRVGFEEQQNMQLELLKDESRPVNERIQTVGMSEGPEISPERRAEKIKEIEGNLEAIRIIREFDAQAQKMDPVRSASDGIKGFAQNSAYGLLGSTGYMAASMVPGIGVPLMFSAVYSAEKEDLLLRNPDMSLASASSAALQYAIPSTVLERIQWNIFKGKAPVFAETLKSMTLAKKGWIGVAVHAGGDLAIRTGQETAVEVTQGWLKIAMNSINEDLPNYDSQKEYEGLKDSLPETVGTMFLMSLFGTGVATFSDVRNGERFLTDTKVLRQAGLSDADAVAVSAEATPEAREAKLKEVWPNRTPESIAAGVAEQKKAAQEAKERQESSVTPTWESTRQEDGSMLHTIKGADGRVIVSTLDPEEAERAIEEERKAFASTSATGIQEAVDFYQGVQDALGRGEDLRKVLFEGAPKSFLQLYKANPSQKNLDRLFETVRHLGDDISEPGQLANYFAAASNQGEIIEGVYRGVIKLSGAADPKIFLREMAQESLKAAMAEEGVQIQWVREQLESMRAIKGYEKLITDTDTAVIESFSDVAVNVFLGRTKEAEVPSGLRGFLRQVAALGREIIYQVFHLKRAIADGRVDKNWHEFLARSVGLDLDRQIAIEGAKAVRQMESDALGELRSGDYAQGDEILDILKNAPGNGKLPSKTSKYWASSAGELQSLQDAVKSIGRGNYKNQKGMLISDIFSKDAMDPDMLLTTFNENGFDFFTVDDMYQALQERFLTGKPMHGYRSNDAMQGEHFSAGKSHREMVEPETGIHYLAKPIGEAYKENHERETDPASVLSSLVRAGESATAGKRRKHGRQIAGYSELLARATNAKQTVGSAIFEGIPLASGGEHSLFYAPDGRVYKITKAGLFGAHGEDAGAYLQRWALANRIFGDKSKFAGMVFMPGEQDARTVISQPFIIGRDATADEISGMFKSKGFVEVGANWVNPVIGVTARDAITPGNIITTPEGKSVPVDLILEPSSASDLKAAREKSGLAGDAHFSTIRKASLEPEAVQNALDARMRNPTVRLKVYERAKAMFEAERARRGDSIDPNRKFESLRQSMAELNAILSVLPPEIRGKVGGMMTLANLGKDTVSGNRVETIDKFIVKRIGMIDKALERALKDEYGAKMDRILERAKPKSNEPGKKPVGKLGNDIHAIFDSVRLAMEMTPEQADAAVTAIEAEIAKGELTAAQEAHKLQEAGMIAQVADWKNADAERRAGAVDSASNLFDRGYLQFQIKKGMEREARIAARKTLEHETGKAGTGRDRDLRQMEATGLSEKMSDISQGLVNFEQVLSWTFGETSEEARKLANAEREASNAKVDLNFEVTEKIESLFTRLAGGKFEGEKLAFSLSQKGSKRFVLFGDVIIDPKAIRAGQGEYSRTLSQMEGVAATLMWRQADGQRHMLGNLDDNGLPVGKWHYNQEFINEIEGQLSPDAKAVREFIAGEYGKEWAEINPIFQELNGVNLPRHENYSPLTVVPVQAQKGQTLDPVTGSTFSGSSFTPGSLRTRGSSTAEPDFRDALKTFVAHKMQMNHWIAYTRFSANARGILGNRELGNSIEAASGEKGKMAVASWLDVLEAGGSRDASAHLALNERLSEVSANAASVAIIGRIGTVLLQTTQLAAASAEMPPGAYFSRLAKLMSGNLGWDKAFNSPFIQRRVKELPPIARIAMDGLRAAKPTRIKHGVRKLGQVIGGADGLFTAGTYAIIYDWKLAEAREMGFHGVHAESYAAENAERITERVAQPTRPGARSLFEATTTNPAGRVIWAFGSEARKNFGLLVYSSANRTPAQKVRTVLALLLGNALFSTLIRAAWADIRDPEDDEIFDAKHWSPKNLFFKTVTDFLYGVPILGNVAQQAILSAAGVYSPDGDLLSSFKRGVPAAARIPAMITGEQEIAETLRDIDAMLSSMGMLNGNIAAAASFSHLARDIYGVGANAVESLENP